MLGYLLCCLCKLYLTQSIYFNILYRVTKPNSAAHGEINVIFNNCCLIIIFIINGEEEAAEEGPIFGGMVVERGAVGVGRPLFCAGATIVQTICVNVGNICWPVRTRITINKYTKQQRQPQLKQQQQDNITTTITAAAATTMRQQEQQ